MERRIQEVLQMVRLSPLRKKTFQKFLGRTAESCHRQRIGDATLGPYFDEPTSQLDPISADEC